MVHTKMMEFIPVKFTATCDKNPNPRVKNGKQMHFYSKILDAF